MKIETLWDFLYHFPYRYENFSNIQPVAKVRFNEVCCAQGKILEIKNIRTWKKRIIITEAILADTTGAIKVVWFNQPYLIKNLKTGDTVCLAGKVALGKNGVYFQNPVYEKISDSKDPQTKSFGVGAYLTHTGRIVPFYPETTGISSRWLRWIIKSILTKLKYEIPEILPQEIIKTQKLLPIQKAMWQIHFPDSMKMAQKAKERFSFEELFLIELSVLQERIKTSKEKAFSIPLDITLTRKFVRSLPFRLTDAQKKCSWRVLKDLEKSRPMSRLLEGDVGSGKTLVAVIAALNTVRAGYQVAFMAPTEILAKQHFNEVSKLLRPFKVRIALLTGKEDKIISQKLKNEILEISRQGILEKARKGEIDVLIGTHSLIQDKVKFKKLALAIVDEQHRFGVGQRAKLVNHQTEEKITIPHFLSMTATPIPRTLALTIYGDLDLSILDEMPKGRKKVITEIVPPKERQKAYDFIRKKVEEGQNIFVICPRIESENSKIQNPNDPLRSRSSEASKSDSNSEYQNKRAWSLSWADAKAVKEEYEKLSKKIFPDLKVGMLHGKMKSSEKEKIMKDFRAKKINILVSTSVVEVGIDIPEATVMMIEGAERFGLSQLYQFRGRVGRSDLQSFCFLFSESRSKKTYQRLKAILQAKSGFELAQKDLEIRGPGSLSGVKQWGIPDFAMETLKNINLVEKTREAAYELLRGDPILKQYPFLKERVKSFKKRIHLE